MKAKMRREDSNYNYKGSTSRSDAERCSSGIRNRDGRNRGKGKTTASTGWV